MTLKLQSSTRTKHRYLLIEAASKAAIEQAILDGIGVFGWAKAAPLFVSGNTSLNNRFILAVARESLNEIRAAFELSQEKIKVLRVSGTLKGLKK